MTLLFGSWTTITFLTSVLITLQVNDIPHLNWLFPLSAILLLSIRFSVLKPLIGLAFGLWITIFHMHIFVQKIALLHNHGANITIIGEVDSFFKQISHGYEGEISIKSINGQAIDFYQTPKVKLRTDTYQFRPGERVELNVASKPVIGLKNEAGFDTEQHFISNSLVAIVKMNEEFPTTTHRQENLRSRFHALISNSTNTLTNQGLILALSFADRSLIKGEDWDNLKSSGLAHLVAISGLHIGLAFGVGYALGIVIRILLPAGFWLPLICAFVFALTYAWLAGFSLSTSRALIMCSIVGLLTILRIKLSAWKVIGSTLAIIFFFDPFSAYSSSFWLSFGAVICIYLALVSRHGSLVHRWFRVQFLLFLGLLPITGWFFGGFAPLAPFYNLVFVPLFSFVLVPLIFMALAATLVNTIFDDFMDISFLWHAVNLMFDLTLRATQYSQGAWISLSSGLIVVVCAILACLLLRFVIVIPVSILVFALMNDSFTTSPTSNANTKTENWQLKVLDVGHGLAILIEKQNRYWLYDTGAAWESGSMVDHVINPVLKRQGANSLDGVIISHTDNDHAGGLNAVVQTWQPKFIYSPQYNVGNRLCRRGQKWQWMELEFNVLWPINSTNRAFNPHSCVVKVGDGTHSVLLAGDIDAVAEYMLTKLEPKELISTVIIVPHHGSATSSRSHFIDLVAPKIAIASLAKSGRWNLPAPNVIERYQKLGSEWIDTGNAGQVTLSFSNEEIDIEREREQTKDLWYRKWLRNEFEKSN